MQGLLRLLICCANLDRDVFLDFDPIAVSKLNDKKIATPGNPASSLLSEVKLRAIIENARQICKVCTEKTNFYLSCSLMKFLIAFI